MSIETLLHMGFPNLPEKGSTENADTEKKAYICEQNTVTDEK